MLTSMMLGYPFAFTPQIALHLRLQARSRHRPIARDRRRSLLGRFSVNNPGQDRLPFGTRFATDRSRFV
jgi:hypothetical protein